MLSELSKVLISELFALDDKIAFDMVGLFYLLGVLLYGRKLFLFFSDSMPLF